MGHFTASVYMNRIEQILFIPVLPFPNMLKLREERVCPKKRFVSGRLYFTALT